MTMIWKPTRRSMRRAAVTLAILGSLAGCSQKEQQAPPSTQVSSGPQAAPGTPAALASGREQFLTRCAFCHGETGKGDTTVAANYPAANLTDGTWKHGSSRDAIMKTIHDGVPETPMAGFAESMTSEEIANVADYVLSLHK
jgi:mono/diheme cytochrome c family protein